MSEVHPLSVTKEEWVAKAASEYDSYRERHPAKRCVGTNRDGKPCLQFATPGRDLCQHHGGLIDKERQRLAANETGLVPYKAKKRKIKLTGRMGEIREIITEDVQNILDSTEEIEVLTSRFQFLLESMDGLPILSQKVMDEYDKWQEVKKSGNKMRFAEQTSRLERSIEACRAGAAATQEFYVATEQLRRMKETEMKRRVSMRQMMDAGDATKLVDATKSCVEAGLATIADPEIKRAFKKAFMANYRKIFMMPAEPNNRDLQSTPDPVRGQ